jgi:hypothetical protein
MALNARKVKSNSGPKAPAIDEGAYPARLVQVIDLGLQKQEFGGEVKPPKNDIWTTYELVDEFMTGEDGEPDTEKPRWLSERIPLNNLDSDLAKSTKRYYALDPNEEEDGEWANLLGRPALVVVTKKKREDGDRNYIGGTSAPRAKDAAKYAPLVNEPKVFMLDNPDLEVFNSLPDFLKEIIKEGLEFEGSLLDKLLKGDVQQTKIKTKKEEKIIDDEIPFEKEGSDHGVPESVSDSDGDW